MKVIIVVSGGTVQEVLADQDLEFKVVDLDTEEMETEDLQGWADKAFVSSWKVETDPIIFQETVDTYELEFEGN